jgi:hypothetical protein
MPTQVNATLTGVTGATAATGGRDDWDAPATEPAGAGPVKWTGSAGAYLRESVQRVVTDGNVDVVPLSILYIDTAVADAAGVDTDDVLSFTGPDGVARIARARAISRSSLPGVLPGVATTRLDLDLER